MSYGQHSELSDALNPNASWARNYAGYPQQNFQHQFSAQHYQHQHQHTNELQYAIQHHQPALIAQ
jgi:hypothetical protein